MKKLVLSIVLVAVLVSLLAPVAFAGGPPGNQGWFQRARNAVSTQTQAQKTFFNSGKAVQTGVPGVRANDLTSAEGRAAFLEKRKPRFNRDSS